MTCISFINVLIPLAVSDELHIFSKREVILSACLFASSRPALSFDNAVAYAFCFLEVPDTDADDCWVFAGVKDN